MDTTLTDHISHTPSDGGAMMKRLNPLWRDTPGNSSSTNLKNEYAVAWLCDPEEWTSYKTGNSSFAIGSPSIEMYMKAFNVWKTGNKNADNLICKIGNTNGYSVGAHGDYAWNDSDEYCTGDNSIEPGPNNIFMTEGSNYWWLASPSSGTGGDVLLVDGSRANVRGEWLSENYGVSPVVPLDQ